jgi:hypothetical protein
MAIADNEPHSPELEVAVEGVTCRFFTANFVVSLAAVLTEVWKERAGWIARRDELAAWCRERYSVERMVDGMVAAISASRSGSESGSR